jgi:hypothetical protein
MPIRRWMTENPVVIAPTDTLAEARRKMGKGNFRRLPVVENGQLVGIITEPRSSPARGPARAHAVRCCNGEARHHSSHIGVTFGGTYLTKVNLPSGRRSSCGEVNCKFLRESMHKIPRKIRTFSVHSS